MANTSIRMYISRTRARDAGRIWTIQRRRKHGAFMMKQAYLWPCAAMDSLCLLRIWYRAGSCKFFLIGCLWTNNYSTAQSILWPLFQSCWTYLEAIWVADMTSVVSSRPHLTTAPSDPLHGLCITLALSVPSMDMRTGDCANFSRLLLTSKVWASRIWKPANKHSQNRIH